MSFFVVKQVNLQTQIKLWGSRLLQFSVILLGASLNFHHVLQQGASGAVITFVSISLVFLLGFLGQKLLQLEKNQSLLITMGTAICGGSAIAALAPVIAADSVAITISIGIVFLLNALAVFIFPLLGEMMSLSQQDFGLWAALAIHDTSSVVAASSIYGEQALAVATTVKLTRALWIIPITLLFSFYPSSKIKRSLTIPWFIFGFVAMSLIFTFIDSADSWKNSFQTVSKLGFSLTLFCIGLSFDFQKMKKVGINPLFFGIGLWIIVSVFSLAYIKMF
ncbi:MAG: putative sulfate exporter family transporter [Bdellovibrionales bacterium]|nr:putative sulfate exporter family transporter [Bdellovibrionales bacterium]